MEPNEKDAIKLCDAYDELRQWIDKAEEEILGGGREGFMERVFAISGRHHTIMHTINYYEKRVIRARFPDLTLDF